MLIRREEPPDIGVISAVHADAFATGTDWLGRLSLVAVVNGEVVGHVCCSRGRLDTVVPALGLGPLGVSPGFQRCGVGKALMHAVLGAAMALDEPLVCLLGDPAYYRRFGFLPASRPGVLAPDAAWGDYFQARVLLQPGERMSGRFSYADAFGRVCGLTG